jgi:hypothetical protein
MKVRLWGGHCGWTLTRNFTTRRVRTAAFAALGSGAAEGPVMTGSSLDVYGHGRRGRTPLGQGSACRPDMIRFVDRTFVLWVTAGLASSFEVMALNIVRIDNAPLWRATAPARL